MFFGSFSGNLFGFLYFTLFILGGIIISLNVFSFSGFKRLWLGSVIGTALLMWLPVLVSFVLGFNKLSHIVAALILAALCVLAYFLCKNKRIPLSFDKKELYSLCLIIPLCFFYAIVETNHIMEPTESGGMIFGQSTYYDANIHLSFITTPVKQGKMPFQYNIYPDAQVSYPFLCDTVSSSIYIWGSSLRFAYVLPTVIGALNVFAGAFAFFFEWLKKFSRAALAWILFFFNGGFGFVYFFENLRRDPSNFSRIFTALYETPTNLNEKMIRWVNTVCDMMIPQRATLFGWMMLFAVLFLLYRAVFEKEKKLYVYAGVLAGLTPLISTHIFLSLGIISAVWMISRLWKMSGFNDKYAGYTAVGILIATVLAFIISCLKSGSGLSTFDYDSAGFAALIWGGMCLAAVYVFLIITALMNGKFRELALSWGVFLIAVLIFAMPQLILFTFRQSSGTGFLRPHFNWINGQDEYLWFYIKNVGVCALLIIPAVIWGSKRLKSIVAPAAVLMLIADTYALQPNPYDNNKLLYPAYVLVCGAVAAYMVELYGKIKCVKGSKIIAVTAVTVCTLSAVLSMGREAVSDQYEMYSPSQVRLSLWLDKNVESDAVLLTNDRYNNAITSLTGLNIVCGSSSFLSPHGLDENFSLVQTDVNKMYSRPKEFFELFAKYGVTHIVVGNEERSSYSVDETALSELFESVYQCDGITVYKVK